MKNSVKRTVAAVSLALIAGTVSSPTLLAQESKLSPEAQSNVDKLSSCISTKKKADLLFVVDESASLRGHNGEATDPENVRVDAASYLIKTLGQTARDHSASINVKVAGFGETYNSTKDVYGDWVDVGDDPGALKSAIEGFADRNNQLYTNYPVALEGAIAEISNHSEPNSCRSILFFTDGLLTAPGDKTADEKAKEQVCSSGGLVEQLRHSGIQLFTVGLIPAKEDSPAELLQAMAETNQCGPGAEPNGAFFNATSDPNGLFSAFRGILPQAGSAFFEGKTQDPFSFILDDSITDLRISAQPKDKKEQGKIIPTLTSPSGKTVDLVEGATELDGASLKVSEVAAVPGMIDLDLNKKAEQKWAGEWTFAYRAEAGNDTRYRAQMQILPGMSLKVDELEKGESTGLKSDQKLHVTLLDKENKPHALEGKASVKGEFISSKDGKSYALGKPQDIRDGKAVEIPLSVVEEPLSGELVLTTDITTKGFEGKPGTALSPLVTRYPVSITPVNMPSINGGIDLAISEKETVIEVPVEGPGKVWLNDVQADKMTLPNGAKNVKVSSPNSDKASALTLKKGEKAVLPISITSDQLADGPVSIHPKVGLLSQDGKSQAEVDLALTGTMRAPVNKTAFSVVMLLTLLFAILIPLGILFAMKFITGVIPRKKLYGYTVPIELSNGTIRRQGDTQQLSISYEQVQSGRSGVMPHKRDVTIQGKRFRVKTGMNPFAASFLMAEKEHSVADSGKRYKKNARLPLDLIGHWVLFANPTEPNKAEVLLVTDSSATSQDISAMVQQIRSKAPDHFATVAGDKDSKSGSKKSAPRGGKKQAVNSANSPQTPPAAGQPSSNLFDKPSNPPAGGSSPFDSPSNPPAGGSSPFGGPSNPPAGGSSPFGGPSNPPTGGDDPFGSSGSNSKNPFA